MTSIEHISTIDVPQASRVDYWNEVAEETYPGMYIDAEREGFRAEMRRWSFGPITMIRPRSTDVIVHRKPTAALNNSLMLHFQHSGTSTHYQYGRNFQLSAGEFSVNDGEEYHRTNLSGSYELLVVQLPRAPLHERIHSIDDKLAVAFRGASPSAHVLHDFLLSLWRNGDLTSLDSEWLDGATNVLYDLLALAMEGADSHPLGELPPSGVLSLIDSRLGDPELNTASLAEELNKSKRTVQNVFAKLGTTPTTYILNRRLERAAELLLSEPKIGVTELSFELGFRDSNYFSRCFRKKHGISPSLFRAQYK